MLWVCDPSDPAQVYWLEEAWDDDSIQSNSEGWEEAKTKAYTAYGPECVRIVVTTVDMDDIRRAFEPTRVRSTGTRDPKDALFQQRVNMTRALMDLRRSIPSNNPDGTAQRRGIQRAIKTIDRVEE